MLIIETGLNVENANSYQTSAQAQAFLDDRGIDITVTDAMMFSAMDALNDLDYSGIRTNESQALPFPRLNVYLSDNRSLGGDRIPTELKQAQIWLAHYLNSGVDLSAVEEQAVKREKVDVLEVEYQDGTTTSRSIMDLPRVSGLLKYLVGGGNSNSIGRH